MLSLSPPATLVTQSPSAEPAFIAKLECTAPTAKTLWLSDRYLVLADGTECLPMVASWGDLEAALGTLDVGGRPSTATIVLFNTRPIEGRERFSDLLYTPHNSAGATYELAFARVTIFQMPDVVTAAAVADLVVLNVFYLEEPTEIGEDLLTLRMTDEALVLEDRLAVTRVTRDLFPQCPRDQVDAVVPRPFGVLKNVPVVPVVDSATDRLAQALLAAGTSLTLEDATDFPASGTLQVDSEHITYAGKSGHTLTGLTRGVNSTAAADHQDGAAVYEVRAGTQAYRFAAGEHAGAHKIRSVTNVTVDGTTPSVTPAIQLEVTDLVPGRSFAILSFPAQAKYFAPAEATAERNVSVSTITDTLSGSRTVGVSTISVTLNGGATSSQTRTVSPSCAAGTTSTARTVTARVVRSGSNLTGTVNYWRLYRRLSGGSDVLIASGSFASGAGGTTNISDTQGYASTADEILTFEYQFNNCNDSLLELIVDSYYVADSATVSQTRTVAPSCGGGTTSTDRVINARVVRSGPLGGTVAWTVKRRLSGGSDVAVDAGSFGNEAGGTQNVVDTRTYDSTADEIVTLEYTHTGTAGDTLDMVFDLYKVTDHSSVTGGGGPTSIGTILCDVEGLQDDASGTITGTPSGLLTNPADVVRFILSELYGVTGALGSSFATTRARLVAYRWAFLLQEHRFSDLRRKLGEQARSILHLTAGVWEFEHIEAVPVADLTLDYARDVSRDVPAIVRRTPRVDVVTRLTVKAQYDYAGSRYRSVVVHEDLGQPGLGRALPGTLELDLVQDAATASALGAFWLSQLKRPRWLVELVTFWNALGVETVDHFRLAGQPVLAAHGGEGLIFRVQAVSRLLGEENPGRIRVQGIETVTLPPPRDPEEGEDMVFNCRLVGVSATEIRLDPWNGNQVRIKVGTAWQVGTVPDAGVSLSNAGMAADTLYRIYLWDNNGTLTLEPASTAWVRDSATGIPVKSGDATRALVGMIRTNAAGQFEDAVNVRLIASYYNRLLKSSVANLGNNVNVTTTSFSEVATGSRVHFLAWADDDAVLQAHGGCVMTGAGLGRTTIAIDDTTAEETAGRWDATTAGMFSNYVPVRLAEGYHWGSLFAAASANGLTLEGGSVGSRTSISALVRG
jgi:hypothetical protein